MSASALEGDGPGAPVSSLEGLKGDVLVVEDDRALSDCFCMLLDEERYRATAASSLAEARKSLAATEFVCVVLDFNLPDGTGEELLREFAQESSRPRFVLVSAATAARVIAETFSIPYIRKPFDIDELLAAVDDARRSSLEGPSRAS